jgi:predicted kinase
LLTENEARAVRWIIEHHLPYQYKDKEKRRALAVGTSEALRHANVSYETFFNCVWSDASGRISDDHQKKMQDVADWTAEFKTIDVTPDSSPNAETCYLLIGPSGSGKTTWRDQFDGLISGIHPVYVTSRDDMSLEFYFQSKKWAPSGLDAKGVYAAAWNYANMDNPKGFDSFFQKSVRKKFEQAKEWKAPVVVDVVNASKKRRAHYVQEARRAGMRVVAVEFWNTLETLLKRQGSRPDKAVPDSSVRQQLYAMNCAWLGTEVDNAYIIVGQ